MYANPTLQRTIRKSQEKIFRTISVDLNGIRALKCNSERVVIFHSVILQRTQGINRSKHICAHIFFWLDFYNCGAFGDLVKDTFNVAMGYLGKSHGMKTKEQSHCTFSNLVLKGKLHEAERFICARERGGFCKPKNLQRIKRSVLTKPSHQYWRENILTKNSLLCHIINVQQNAYFYSRWNCRGHSWIGRAKTFRGFMPRRCGLGSYTWVDFKIMGGQKKTTY